MLSSAGGLSGADGALLLEPLIAGLAQDPPWAAFLDALRARVRADYVSVTFRPFAGVAAAMPMPRAMGEPTPSRVIHLASGRQSPPIVAELYRTSLYDRDPVPYHELAEGRVYALPELLRGGDPAHDAYRQALLAPSGMNLMRMMRLAEPGGVSAWLSLSRGGEEDFSPQDDALIASLAPFLRAALGAFVALERARNAAAIAGEAISRMAFAWATLDANGVVLDTDAQGAKLLAEPGRLTRGRAGRLTARDGEVARAIASAIAALAGNPQARPRAIVLSREPWLDMLLVPASLRPGATGPAPSLIAYFHADRWSSADRCEQLGQLFDLLPSEARLALALSRGMSIAEAAGELGLTVESARTYSKRIYAKTGARGQADLVRFIHRSVLALA
jgi:DNA-binding CsgD family transcriptional regulator